MKKRNPDQRDWHEIRIEEARRKGLANEARPGLGTRNADPKPASKAKLPPAKSGQKPEATPRGYEEPRPEPREQPPDSRAHDEERSTGISGQSSGT